jgi:hypothetical protein
LVIFAGCTEKPLTDEVVIGIAWRGDTDSEFYTNIVDAVEEAYKGKGYSKITLTTFGFQAPGFYKKQGYELEFVREDKDPKLSKYFFAKHI